MMLLICLPIFCLGVLTRQYPKVIAFLAIKMISTVPKLTLVCIDTFILSLFKRNFNTFDTLSQMVTLGTLLELIAFFYPIIIFRKMIYIDYRQPLVATEKKKEYAMKKKMLPETREKCRH